jgi:glutathione synthase/RimK-type ligase-like ATP-grasp enzyme
MPMPSIAFATYSALPALAPDEHALVDLLATLGVSARPAVWDDPTVTWTEFDAVVIRSCWDYHLRVAEFFAWIDRVSSLGVQVWNPPRMLRWNSRKTYLHDLAVGGVRTVPTLWLTGDGARRSNLSLERILVDTGWDVAVVKPIVSASSHGTWRLSRDEARVNHAIHDARLRTLVEGHGAMIQPFVPEIATDGEWSLLFFDGELSHVVQKRAAKGDFRVQRMFGGTFETMSRPTPRVLEAAERALHGAPGDPLYARVDGVILDSDLVVTELELLEPSLFLDADPEAALRFAETIANRF